VTDPILITLTPADDEAEAALIAEIAELVAEGILQEPPADGDPEGFAAASPRASETRVGR
jgi:hypothetical protein